MLKRRNFPRPFSDNSTIHLFVIFMATISLGKINHLDKFITKYQLNHYQYYMILVRRLLQNQISSTQKLENIIHDFFIRRKKVFKYQKVISSTSSKINKKEYNSLGLKHRGSNKYCYVRAYVNIFVYTIISTSVFKQPQQSLLLLLPTCQFRMA